MLTKQCKMKIYFSAIWPQQVVIDMHIDEWNENGKTLVKSRAMKLILITQVAIKFYFGSGIMIVLP